MILLDTNVVSELWRPTPNLAVVSWVDAQPRQTQYLCAPVIAELRFGILRLEEGARKNRLSGAADRLFQGFRGRVLNFDMTAAEQFARISSVRERHGRRLEPMDAMIAAVALVHRMTLATRNIDDFTGIGLDLIDPFAPIVG